MKKRVLFFQIGLFMFLFCTFFVGIEDVSAFDDKIKLGETKVIKSQFSYGLVDISGVNSKMKVKVEITNVATYNVDGNIVNDTIHFRADEDSDKIWSVKTGGTLTFTYYVDEDESYLNFDVENADEFSFNLRITKVSDAKLTISCHKTITMKDTGAKRVYPVVYYGDEDVSEYAEFKAKASKKKFIDIDTICSETEDYFYLNGIGKSGKCKITVTAKYEGQSCSDSFILNVKSTLKKNLYVFGYMKSYNTRSNVFKMSLTNWSKKPIKIYSKGAVALDDDYVSFDRRVKMTKKRKTITIKPGKSKTINWKVIGSTTWYDVEDFEIQFKCKYKGKKSWLSVQDDSVYVWKKKKWKKMS